MKRVFNIAWKDLMMTFRDPMGLLLMLAAPIGLTLVIAFAFGGLGGSQSNSGLHDVPLAIVNLDKGEYGKVFTDVLMPSADQIATDPQSKQIADLIEAKLIDTEAEAKKLVDDKQYAAALLIPETFSESIVPSGLANGAAGSTIAVPSTVTLYVNPARVISANVIRSIAQSIIDQFMAGSSTGQVAVMSLITSGRLSPADAVQKGSAIANEMVKTVLAQQPITVDSVAESDLTAASDGGQESAAQATNKGFDWLSYMAPSMAVMYLMFTMSNASRSILNEQQHGTLPRMLVSPTSRASVLGGKMLGVYLTGLMQMAVLILAGKLLFNISYGEPLAVLIFTLVLVAAATAWGMLEAAIAKSSGQANALGWMINLTFAALAGNFIPRQAYPPWLQNLGLITPNAWGIDTYYKMVQGGGIQVIGLPLLVLGGMTVVLFTIAVLIFRKRYV
jgi:ABC-2 type transport system permease protein